ncbi:MULTISPECIES: cation:proton antiporter [unclassified Imperialibacter]|uniref:cation:proton antiporter domain-containing protein n=1 Tax=unclassified Imperialibacter TaxID=2629706 RepID=UPI0012530FFF|nr:MULTISPECIES: cation:proton antiporter [unclassified Imperialibacter]CAD5253774.1 Na+/H+ antiporter NhaP [Imperialibacter sp. 75]CAD5262127.1 Na+/H+ antiporter NhaP [Imperialibacter sp. 89]VVT35191.1 Na+/H+ antiporter NhaP [Imperialibacter sp. EC-SDR9]
MDMLNAYSETIAISIIIIASYFFNQFSKKTNIPSVLLLIGLGVGFQELLNFYDINLERGIMEALELLGVVGLIMIVLEAALDLKLTKEKKPLLIKSFLVALLSLIATSIGIAYLLKYFFFDDFYTALIYAVPLSILSSAIIIPSVGNLSGSKKEFMIYESTFSDILGIMFFYFLLGSAETATTAGVVWEVSSSILITIALSIIISYSLVLLLQKLTTKVKLFFLIAVLVLLYSTGKMFHLSSLLIIMVFGLVLSNHTIFFRGKLKKLIDETALKHILEDFHVVTMESAFVVRTFFFVIFGMTLDFSGLTDVLALITSLTILVLTYVVRYILLKSIVVKNISPQVWIAPRGLITVLLFFSIPDEWKNDAFSDAILLIVIIATSVLMTLGLVFKKQDFEDKDELEFTDWDKLDQEIEALTKTK